MPSAFLATSSVGDPGSTAETAPSSACSSYLRFDEATSPSSRSSFSFARNQQTHKNKNSLQTVAASSLTMPDSTPRVPRRYLDDGNIGVLPCASPVLTPTRSFDSGDPDDCTLHSGAAVTNSRPSVKYTQSFDHGESCRETDTTVMTVTARQHPKTAFPSKRSFTIEAVSEC
jgi:hypothetical protein